MDRRVEPVRLARAPFLAERDEARTARTVARRLGLRGVARFRRGILVFVVEVIRGARALRRGRALQELRRVAAVTAAALTAPVVARRAGRALGRVAADLALQLDDVEEDVAWRRSSSATIGGWVEMVDTTVTRTPLRWIASTSERKSPSPENSTM